MTHNLRSTSLPRAAAGGNLIIRLAILMIIPLFLAGRRFNPLRQHLPREQAAYLTGRVVALADTSGEFLGSGFFVGFGRNEKVYLVTNFHVVGKRTRLMGFKNGQAFEARVLSRDRDYDVAVLGADVEELPSSLQTVALKDFVVVHGILWPGMLTVSAAYPLGIDWPPASSPAVSFSHIAQLDGADSLIRVEGLLDLGSSGAPVFTWIEEDRGRRLHLVGMARSFQVARCLSDVSGDTLVLHSRLYEIVPASAIREVLLVTDSLLNLRVDSLKEVE
ncbi:trypsin-like peptidase domain-containing protein [candidate division WOR-3 bacterium]|nr:trypsin-like peptidase domain-containing protein [candidate division WOR-3 bacterium]